MLKDYSNNIYKTYSQGDAREESYYHHLSKFISDFSSENNYKNISVTILPKKTDAGNPDFRVWDGKNKITGYIEAKEPKIIDLDRIEESEQLLRYRSTFPNVILTNFYEFRLYRDGKLIDKVNISKNNKLAHELKTKPPIENEDKLYALFNKYFSFTTPVVRSAQVLAKELAKRTRFLRDEVIKTELSEDESENQKSIHGFYEAFKKYLIHNLTHEQFADLYAQTITYGLFAARTRSNNDFNRELAYKYIPHTIGILSDIFKFISLEEPSEPMQVMVDDIAETLSVTDIKAILSDYYSQGKGSDPILHFYETFLAEFDPSLRERRGVYYTPEPVVNFIVQSIHNILKNSFNKHDGLASQEVTILDPAAGTLTFPAEAVKCAVSEYTTKYGDGGKSNFIKTHILKNYYALELMMAPYAIGHLKMSFVFNELGYSLSETERFKLYLTNTLEMEDYEQIQIPGLKSLSEESHLAGIIKKEEPILVILGNPPYSGISANINEWTEKLLKEDYDGTQSYYKIDDKPLGEKKVWLQDDYVKFIRFAQWKIHTVGFGIVGMITNHSYLDNPTFRGMRQSLMKTFNDIYILNLHGVSSKNYKVPDGIKDENVFDITKGVSISIFIKYKNQKHCNVYYFDKFGTREMKYNWLENNCISSIKYKKLKPESPWYFFIPRSTKQIQHYLDWPKINEIFPVNNVGIVTARDSFAIDYELQSLKVRINQFRDLKVDESLLKEAYGLKDTSTFKLTKFRLGLSKEKNWQQFFKEITYRPFDNRYIYYSKWVLERPIYDTMRHMLNDNVALITARSNKSNIMNHFFVTNKLMETKCGESTTQSAIFPLYIYPDEENGDLFNGNFEKKPNIPEEIFINLKQKYKHAISPEEILSYIYGIFYSNTYREKYSEFIKIDFPRVPFTNNYKIFKSISIIGDKLIELHLLQSSLLSKSLSKFKGKGENIKIERIKYDHDKGYIYINKDKYFDNVPYEVWNYQIGGYKVIDKYLKYRKDQLMKDPRHVCQMITAIHLTIKLQKELNSYFEKVEESLLD